MRLGVCSRGTVGGEGNLAATGSVGTAARKVQRSELFSSWIRPQSIQQLKQRAIANTHEEEGYIQSLLADAQWSPIGNATLLTVPSRGPSTR